MQLCCAVGYVLSGIGVSYLLLYHYNADIVTLNYIEYGSLFMAAMSKVAFIKIINCVASKYKLVTHINNITQTQNRSRLKHIK